MVYVCLVGMAALAAYLMTMVPSIANGLMSGSSVGSGFKGVGVITNGVAIRGGLRATDATSRAAGKGLKVAAKTTGTAVKRTAQLIKQVLDKRKNGSSGSGGGGSSNAPRSGSASTGTRSGGAEVHQAADKVASMEVHE